MVAAGAIGAERTTARSVSIGLGVHHVFVVINRRFKAAAEHPFMIRRGDECGFASAEFVQPGDLLVDERMDEEEVVSVVRMDAPIRTVAIHIPGANTLLAEDVWVHNDMPATAHSSGSGSSSSGSGSGSGVIHQQWLVRQQVQRVVNVIEFLLRLRQRLQQPVLRRAARHVPDLSYPHPPPCPTGAVQSGTGYTHEPSKGVAPTPASATDCDLLDSYFPASQ